VLEQNYDATQRIPAYRSERAALSTYGQLEDRMALPADWLCARMACAQTFERESMFIADAVAAGLGRLVSMVSCWRRMAVHVCVSTC